MARWQSRGGGTYRYQSPARVPDVFLAVAPVGAVAVREMMSTRAGGEVPVQGLPG